MNPFLLILLALALPIVMLLLLAGPIYAGGFVGLFLLYGQEVGEASLKPEYQIEIYQGLIRHWQAHADSVGWMDFILPAFAPLTVGVLSGLVFFIMFIRYLRRIFTV